MIALKAEGITMSAPSPITATPVETVRNPSRPWPPYNFFRIKAAYFTDDEYYEKLDKELQWTARCATTACADR